MDEHSKHYHQPEIHHQTPSILTITRALCGRSLLGSLSKPITCLIASTIERMHFDDVAYEGGQMWWSWVWNSVKTGAEDYWEDLGGSWVVEG